MSSMTEARLFGGIDSHKDTVHVAAVDRLGRHLADAEFGTTRAGYGAALGWLRAQGDLDRVGIEGTSSYGAGITCAFTVAGVHVVEVNRLDRATRRRLGKSDPIDAYAAAEAVASGRATTVPKDHTGMVESMRVIHLARASAIKARTTALTQIDAMIVTAPAPLRESLTGLSPTRRVTACTAWRPGTDRTDVTTATKTSLRRLARRIQDLTAEITDADRDLDTLTHTAAPQLRALLGVGPETAATVLIAAGANIDRLTSEAALAMMFGAAPLPASSGRTTRHRLNRSGNRQGNRALHTIALTRIRCDPATRAYRDRRHAEGLSKKDIMRCLKRYIARELYPALTATLTT